MADWFKFYENDLDDERLQWAMSEQPHAAIVYIRMMSRCCRDKVRTLSWKDEELELFALAGTLHISVPIVNQCIGLLKRIGYIEIVNGECNLLRWNDRQSEYCKKKDRGVRIVSGQCPDSVRIVSAERRGEEKREEDKKGDGKRGAGSSAFNLAIAEPNGQPKVSYEMVKSWLKSARANGADYTESEARSAFLAFEANGWMWGKNPVMDFRAAIERQIQNDRTHNGRTEPTKKSMSDYTVDDYK